MQQNRRNKKASPVVRVIRLAAFLVFGIALLVLAPQSAAQHKMYEERCTAQITGTVTDTRTETVKIRKPKSKNYTLETRYYFTVSYSVDGQTYSKEREVSVLKHAKNDTIIVHYAPDEPDVSYIEGYMPQDQQKAMTIAGIVVIGLGILFFFIA